MDTMMKYNPAGAENITIRCRNRINWFRVVILTLAYTLIGWLAFGLFSTLLENSLTFWQALITPLALIFLAMNLVATFVSTKNQNGGR